MLGNSGVSGSPKLGGRTESDRAAQPGNHQFSGVCLGTLDGCT